jgi:hypothetical protein
MTTGTPVRQKFVRVTGGLSPFSFFLRESLFPRM